MWSVRVVGNPPPYDGAAGILEAQKPVQLQALVSQSAVEALDDCVFRRLAGRMNWSRIWRWCAQTSSACPVNSGPLSV